MAHSISFRRPRQGRMKLTIDLGEGKKSSRRRSRRKKHRGRPKRHGKADSKNIGMNRKGQKKAASMPKQQNRAPKKATSNTEATSKAIACANGANARASANAIANAHGNWGKANANAVATAKGNNAKASANAVAISDPKAQRPPAKPATRTPDDQPAVDKKTAEPTANAPKTADAKPAADTKTAKPTANAPKTADAKPAADTKTAKPTANAPKTADAKPAADTKTAKPAANAPKTADAKPAADTKTAEPAPNGSSPKRLMSFTTGQSRKSPPSGGKGASNTISNATWDANNLNNTSYSFAATNGPNQKQSTHGGTDTLTYDLTQNASGSVNFDEFKTSTKSYADVTGHAKASAGGRVKKHVTDDGTKIVDLEVGSKASVFDSKGKEFSTQNSGSERYRIPNTNADVKVDGGLQSQSNIAIDEDKDGNFESTADSGAQAKFDFERFNF